MHISYCSLSTFICGFYCKFYLLNTPCTSVFPNIHWLWMMQGSLLEYWAGGVSIQELPWRSSPGEALDPSFWHLAHYHRWIHLPRNWNCKFLLSRLFFFKIRFFLDFQVCNIYVCFLFYAENFLFVWRILML